MCVDVHAKWYCICVEVRRQLSGESPHFHHGFQGLNSSCQACVERGLDSRAIWLNLEWSFPNQLWWYLYYQTNQYFLVLAGVSQCSRAFPRVWNQNSLPSPSLDSLNDSTTSKVSVRNDGNSRGTLPQWHHFTDINILRPEK